MAKLVADGIATEVPAEWFTRSLITLVGRTDKTGFAPNILITRDTLDAGATVGEYAQAQTMATRLEIPDLEVLDERSLPLAGYAAIQRVQRYALDGRTLQQSQTYVLVDRTVFVVTCTATIEDFDNCAPAFRAAIVNLRLQPSDKDDGGIDPRLLNRKLRV